MLALTCDKCGRRFTPTNEELQVYLEQGEGKKHVLVICPHCGRDVRVAAERVEHELRFVKRAGEAE